MSRRRREWPPVLLTHSISSVIAAPSLNSSMVQRQGPQRPTASHDRRRARAGHAQLQLWRHGANTRHRDGYAGGGNRSPHCSTVITNAVITLSPRAPPVTPVLEGSCVKTHFNGRGAFTMQLRARTCGNGLGALVSSSMLRMWRSPIASTASCDYARCSWSCCMREAGKRTTSPLS